MSGGPFHSTSSPSHSQGSSQSSASSGNGESVNKYAPAQPSQLREAHRPPPSPTPAHRDLEVPDAQQQDPHYFERHEQKDFHPDTQVNGSGAPSPGGNGLRNRNINPLSWDQASAYSANTLPEPSTPGLPFTYPATAEGLGLETPEDEADVPPGIVGRTLKSLGIRLSLRTSKWLAKRHGIRHPWIM